MIVERRSSTRVALLGLALALVLPIVACDSKPPEPAVTDTPPAAKTLPGITGPTGGPTAPATTPN